MAVKSKITHLTKDIIRESALKELTWRGYDVWRNNNMAVRGRKFIGRRGVSDIIGIRNDGRWVACEVKTINDRLSEDQKQFLTDIKNAGGIALIAKQNDKGYVIIENFEL
jgi:hypothetical protein